jgi:anti-anti-sigma factor
VELMLQVQSYPDAIALVCHGNVIYGDETEALRAALGRLLVVGDRVIVNLQYVRKIDCAGLGALADAARRAALQNRSLELCSVPARVKTMLRITGLHLVIPMHENQPWPEICRACAA